MARQRQRAQPLARGREFVEADLKTAAGRAAVLALIADADGRYKFQSILPSGYGVPPGSPTEALLSALGRHGQRPAHIHFFISAPGHRKLTTQINIEGDPLLHDDFAYATRDGLVPHVIERDDEASIHANNLNGPFAEIEFDIHLTALLDGIDNQVNAQRKRAAA